MIFWQKATLKILEILENEDGTQKYQAACPTLHNQLDCPIVTEVVYYTPLPVSNWTAWSTSSS